MPMIASPTDVTPYPAKVGSYGKTVESDVIELSLLLPRWQVDALEDAANQRGMTTGQMIRKVIGEMLQTD